MSQTGVIRQYLTVCYRLVGARAIQILLRLRARPKMLVATTYEEGPALYERFKDHLFGVVTDVGFPRDGKHDQRAGIDFIRLIKTEMPDVPVLLQ